MFIDLTDRERGLLFDELMSVKNMIGLALLALDNEKYDLVPTAVETAFIQLQDVLDEYCVIGFDDILERGGRLYAR